MPFRSDPLVFLLAAGLAIAAPARAEDAKAAAQTAAERWDQSFNAGDMETLATLYGADAEVVTKGASLADSSSIRTYFANLKTKGFSDHKVTVQSAKAKGNLVIASGRWEASGPGDGGPGRCSAATGSTSWNARGIPGGRCCIPGTDTASG